MSLGFCHHILLRRASAIWVPEFFCPIHFHFRVFAAFITGMSRRNRDMWSRSALSWYQKPPASECDGAREGFTGWSRRDTRDLNQKTMQALNNLALVHATFEQTGANMEVGFSEGDLLFADVRVAMEGLAGTQQH